jgi:hypothetical protein
MITGIAFILAILLLIAVGRLSFVAGLRRGRKEGKAELEEYWEKLKRTPIAGQSILVPAFGEVIILGRGKIDGVPHIDYIPSKVVNGRNIPDIDIAELSANTISCPLDEFIAQCEMSLKFI